MKHECVDIEFTPRERFLILKYGYPFEGISASLKALTKSRCVELVSVSRFELERLIGDLCASINDAKPGRLQNELFCLCDRLEAAERYGEGFLDEL
ncbi:MAG: hypothetical protein ACK5EA_04790 [Planctomycetaceae bacterium]|jgi:hypothetical protein